MMFILKIVLHARRCVASNVTQRKELSTGQNNSMCPQCLIHRSDLLFVHRNMNNRVIVQVRGLDLLDLAVLSERKENDCI